MSRNQVVTSRARAAPPRHVTTKAGQVSAEDNPFSAHPPKTPPLDARHVLTTCHLLHSPPPGPTNRHTHHGLFSSPQTRPLFPWRLPLAPAQIETAEEEDTHRTRWASGVQHRWVHSCCSRGFASARKSPGSAPVFMTPPQRDRDGGSPASLWVGRFSTLGEPRTPTRVRNVRRALG